MLEAPCTAYPHLCLYRKEQPDYWEGIQKSLLTPTTAAPVLDVYASHSLNKAYCSQKGRINDEEN